jgi:activator of 2-hydroxyglutaryl-CoA dehydratase
MFGGVAKNNGVVKAITASLGIEKLNIPDKLDIIGALEAALIAGERYQKA